jgi:hypothetical protein
MATNIIPSVSELDANIQPTSTTFTKKEGRKISRSVLARGYPAQGSISHSHASICRYYEASVTESVAQCVNAIQRDFLWLGSNPSLLSAEIMSWGRDGRPLTVYCRGSTMYA